MKKNKSKNSQTSVTQKSNQKLAAKPLVMPLYQFDAEAFGQFLKLLNEHQVNEFECEDFRVQLGPIGASVHAAPAMHSVQVHSAPVHHVAAEGAPAPVPVTAHKTAPSNHKTVRSPFVGTFYLSPAPGKPQYTQVGGKVKGGDTLCIVEAMKLMNEIESEFQGKVIEIIAQNGQPVEFDEPLMVIEVS